MQELKSAILAIFQRGLGWPCPVSAALKNPSVDLKNLFALGADEFLPMQCWNAKLERALFCRVQSGKITVYYEIVFRNISKKLQVNFHKLKKTQIFDCIS